MKQAWRKRLCVMACVMGALAGCSGGANEKAMVAVTIKSSPVDGAEVMAGGLPGGLTPTTIELAPGFVDVLLKRDGFKMATDRIEVRTGPPQEFTIELNPLVGYLTVESEPVGAEVILDGTTSLGPAPIYSRDLAVGEHTIDLKMPNYFPVAETLTVEEDFKYTKKYVLKPMEATISLTSRPSGASIFINNEKQAETTPANFTLMPGAYVISVYAEGYVQSEEKIDLQPNEKRNLALNMTQGNVPPGMVLIPAGEFTFGTADRAPDEAPKATINLPAFFIDKTEVTNIQYQAIVKDHKFPAGQEDFPVTGVSWNDAVRFASMSGKRLPTEREWEKAARGADAREYPWGVNYDPALCNGVDQNKEGPVRVSQYIGGMSVYGCMDMAGNVFEWTQDWYEAYPGNTQVTKEYGQVYRVLRGGAYNSDRFDLRCSRRRFDKMDNKKAEYGFRCARDVTN